MFPRIAAWIASKSIFLVIAICAALGVCIWQWVDTENELTDTVVKRDWWEKQAHFFENERDSIARRWVSDTTRLFVALTVEQRKTADFKEAATRATNQAYVYEAQVNTAIAASDRTTDVLSKTQKELAYTRLLLKNKTLSPADSAKGAGSEAVTTAGLKTAERYGVLQTEAAALRASVGTLTGQKQDAETRAGRAIASSFYAEDKMLKIAARRRFKDWLKRSRKKEAAIAAENIRLKRETGVAPDELQVPQ